GSCAGSQRRTFGYAPDLLMPARPDLATLLTDPAAVPVEMIPFMLGQLEALKAALWSRLTFPAGAPPTPEAESAPRITQEGAAAREGIALPVVRSLTRTRRVPSVKEGKSRKLFQGDLAAYVQRCGELGVPLRKGPSPVADRLLHGVTLRP